MPHTLDKPPFDPHECIPNLHARYARDVGHGRVLLHHSEQDQGNNLRFRARALALVVHGFGTFEFGFRIFRIGHMGAGFAVGFQALRGFRVNHR